MPCGRAGARRAGAARSATASAAATSARRRWGAPRAGQPDTADDLRQSPGRQDAYRLARQLDGQPHLVRLPLAALPPEKPGLRRDRARTHLCGQKGRRRLCDSRAGDRPQRHRRLLCSVDPHGESHFGSAGEHVAAGHLRRRPAGPEAHGVARQLDGKPHLLRLPLAALCPGWWGMQLDLGCQQRELSCRARRRRLHPARAGDGIKQRG